MHNDGTWYIRKQGNLMADYHRYSYTNDLSSCIIKQPCYLRHGIVFIFFAGYKPFLKKKNPKQHSRRCHNPW